MYSMVGLCIYCWISSNFNKLFTCILFKLNNVQLEKEFHYEGKVEDSC